MTEINDKAQLDIAAADDTDAVTSDIPEETVNTPEVDETFELSAAKMRERGMSETAINQFRHLYDVWRHEEASSWIREDDIEPLGHVPSFHDVYETINHDKAVDAFAKTAFLKLNGGLGTSMGLDKAKSLLPVRRHKAKQMRFIDIIIGQVLTARTRLNVELPLTFMNSFRTSADTMKALKHHRKFSQHDVPMEIIQHQEPKLVAATGEPVSYPMNPELEWCPPGHGDLFSTIWESGLLDVLEERGFKYLFISNSDNLGARPSRTLAPHGLCSVEQLAVDRRVLRFCVKQRLCNEWIVLQGCGCLQKAAVQRIKRLAGGGQLLLGRLLGVRRHAQAENLQQQTGAQQHRHQRHGQKRRVQPLTEGGKVKPLHCSASVPR